MTVQSTPGNQALSRFSDGARNLREVTAWLESYRPGCVLRAHYDVGTQTPVVHVRNMTEDAWDGALANCGARHTAKLMVGGMIDASAILWNGVHLVTSFVPGEGRGWAIEGQPPVQYGFELVEKRWIVGDDATGIVVEDILP